MAPPDSDEPQTPATPAVVRNMPKPDDYIQWSCLPPGGALNRWSQAITRDHDFPGAQVRFVSASFSPSLFPGKKEKLTGSGNAVQRRRAQ